MTFSLSVLIVYIIMSIINTTTNVGWTQWTEWQWRLRVSPSGAEATRSVAGRRR